jgi:hypothetical protein
MFGCGWESVCVCVVEEIAEHLDLRRFYKAQEGAENQASPHVPKHSQAPNPIVARPISAQYKRRFRHRDTQTCAHFKSVCIVNQHTDT